MEPCIQAAHAVTLLLVSDAEPKFLLQVVLLGRPFRHPGMAGHASYVLGGCCTAQSLLTRYNPLLYLLLLLLLLRTQSQCNCF